MDASPLLALCHPLAESTNRQSSLSASFLISSNDISEAIIHSGNCLSRFSGCSLNHTRRGQYSKIVDLSGWCLMMGPWATHRQPRVPFSCWARMVHLSLLNITLTIQICRNKSCSDVRRYRYLSHHTYYKLVYVYVLHCTTQQDGTDELRKESACPRAAVHMVKISDFAVSHGFELRLDNLIG